MDPDPGGMPESVELPPSLVVSGLKSDGVDQFFCVGGNSGKIRVVRRPD